MPKPTKPKQLTKKPSTASSRKNSRQSSPEEWGYFLDRLANKPFTQKHFRILAAVIQAHPEYSIPREIVLHLLDRLMKKTRGQRGQPKQSPFDAQGLRQYIFLHVNNALGYPLGTFGTRLGPQSPHRLLAQTYEKLRRVRLLLGKRGTPEEKEFLADEQRDLKQKEARLLSLAETSPKTQPGAFKIVSKKSVELFGRPYTPDAVGTYYKEWKKGAVAFQKKLSAQQSKETKARKRGK